MIGIRQQSAAGPKFSAAYPSASAQVVALRPAGAALGTVTLNKRAPVTTNNKHTLATALARAEAIQDAAHTDPDNNPSTWLGPAYRVDIFIAPGTILDETVLTRGWVALVGASGNRDDVYIHTASTANLGTIRCTGPVYFENLTLVGDDAGGAPNTGPRYPWHLSNMTGRGVTTAVNCSFISNNTAISTTGAMGMDGSAGSTCLVYGCTIHLRTNMHRTGANGLPVTMLWINCALDLDAVFYNDNEPQNTTVDHLWYIGNTGVATPTTAGLVTVHTSGTWPYAPALSDSL